MRMVGGGLVQLAVFRPGWPGRHLRWMCLWAVLGLAAARYTWFAAISLSNVATATFIQYLYVALTAAWQMMRGEVRPIPVRLAAVAAAGTGVALVILGQRGAVAGLHVSMLGIVFALASAVATAFMFLGSAPLVRAVVAQSSTAWGLVIGGIPMLLWAPPWAGHATGDPLAVAALVVFAVLGGTALAFSLSFASLRRITPTEVALTSSVEPAVAALTSLIFLGLTLRPLQYVGGALILSAVMILAHAGRFTPG